jgi:flagellar hook-basal body complex protein FliE
MSQDFSISGLDAVRGSSQFLRLDDTPYEAARATEGKPFGQFLTEAIGDVNSLQQQAGEKVQSFATGGNLDVHEVMIATEQASTALALTTQVRNKLVDAYQELMHMQV